MPPPSPGSETPEPIVLQSDQISVSCRPDHGFVVTSIRDLATGAEALWTRPGHRPAVCTRSLGPAGDASGDSFMDLFIGGWFEMFPAAGWAGEMAGLTTHLHGEATRLPWDVLDSSASHVEAEVFMLRTPFHLRRTLRLEGGSVTSTSVATNVGRERAPYTWGHHPCFDRATFADGWIEIAVRDAVAPGPAYEPANSRLVVDQPFAWPQAPALDGGHIDISRIPNAADGRHEHICVTPVDGRARIVAPRYGRAMDVRIDVGALPDLLLWQNYRAPGGSFWGAADTFTLEPATYAGRSTADAVASDAVRWLEPGGSAEVTISLGWSAAS